MRIYLLGFMASGKSSLGPVLAELAGLEYLDLDARIEAHCGMRIAEIWRRRGEAVFRDWESEALRRIAEREGIVLATGGGIVERVQNHPLLRQATGVYLYWTWSRLLPRLERHRAGSVRPLLDEGKAVLKERWHRRDPLYRELSRLVFAPLELRGAPDREAGLRHQAAGLYEALQGVQG